MLFASWIVSASVNRRCLPRAACAPAQHALLLPVKPPRPLRSSGGASRRMTPSWLAAASAAISRVRSVESSLTIISSHCWPRAKPGSDWAGRQGMLFVAGWNDYRELQVGLSGRIWVWFAVSVGHDFVL